MRSLAWCLRFTLLAVLLVTSGCSDETASTEQYLERARTAFEAGDFRTAAVEGRNALELDPRDAEVSRIVGLSFYELGNCTGVE